jgi:release factor glutamine methyltransferase
MSELPATPARLLAKAQRLGVERLDAQLLLLHALGRPGQDRAWLLSHDNEELPEAVQRCFDAILQRRLAGEPLAYIAGAKEFFGLELRIDKRVLVPRPDTETLVQWALDVLQDRPGASVMDLGTGSGAIALALKHSRPDLQVSALDASGLALEVARANANRLALAIEFSQGNWLDGVSGEFDLIVSNPPYIAAQDPHLDKLKHEPQQALISGFDGLDDIRKIVAQAGRYLKAGGWLLIEHGYNQAQVVRQLLRYAGFSQTQSRQDFSGIERCSGGSFKPSV